MHLGTIVVSTGIIPIAKDEHGLAAVISHGKFVHSSSVATELYKPLTRAWTCWYVLACESHK